MSTSRTPTAERLAAPAADRRPPVGQPLPVWFTLLLTGLVLTATLYGLLVPGAYRVPAYLEAIWRAQDLVTVIAVPVLGWAAFRARTGSMAAHLVQVALLLWVAYCYAHLAFGAPYNDMFLVYVAALGLAGYGFLNGLLRTDAATVATALRDAPRRPAAWFLLVAGLGITGLWLSEILAAFPDGQPASNLVYDLPSPTYVLDLAVILPLAFAAARMLLRNHVAGPLLGAVMLLTLFVLSVAMLTLTPFAITAGLHLEPGGVSVFIVFGSIFVVLAAIELALLVSGARRLRPTTDEFLRPAVWPTP